MVYSTRGMMLLSVFGLALAGCAAVIVPVAAGGLVARGKMHHRDSSAADGSTVAASGADEQGGKVVADVAPLPSNLALATPDRFYAGTLPAPTGSPARSSAPAAASADAAVTPPQAPGARAPSRKPASRAAENDADVGTGWSGLVRHVARATVDGATDSILLDRSSTAARPVWLPCGAKPRAVLIDLEAIRATRAGRIDAAVRDDLDALQAMDVGAVFFSVQSPDELARGQALVAQAARGVVRGQNLFLALPGRQPALRAAIGARFCVIGLLGVRAADFPNAILPGDAGASAGWFLAPGSGPQDGRVTKP